MGPDPRGTRVSALATVAEDYLSMIYQWKKALIEGAAVIFGRGGKAVTTAEVAEVAVRGLHAKNGRLGFANDLLAGKR